VSSLSAAAAAAGALAAASPALPRPWKWQTCSGSSMNSSRRRLCRKLAQMFAITPTLHKAQQHLLRCLVLGGGKPVATAADVSSLSAAAAAAGALAAASPALPRPRRWQTCSSSIMHSSRSSWHVDVCLVSNHRWPSRSTRHSSISCAASSLEVANLR
jgi:hypothetical protein